MNHEETAPAAAVRRQLVQLVRSEGAAILDDSRRVRAMLADAVAGATAETNLIGLALSSGVPARLRDADPRSVAAAVDAAAQELERTSSVQAADARWAVGAIAEALGLSVEPARPAPAPEPAGAAKSPHDLTLRVNGREHVASAGSVVTLGRDPDSTIVLDSPAISRRHARIVRGQAGWEYHDEGSTQGSFVNGVAVTAFTLQDETEVTLGQGEHSVRLQLVPFGDAVTRTPQDRLRPAPTPATEIPGAQRPGGALAAGGAPATELGSGSAEMLTVTLAGRSRTVAPGATLTVGREDDNDLVAAHSTVSRHHLKLEHRGGWRLQDLGSTSGTWLAGQRVSDVALSGKQEFVLGDVTNGDRLVVEAPGTSPVVAPQTPKPAGSRLPLVPLLAAAATVVAVVAGVVVWRLVADGDPEPLSRDELARATVFVDTPTGTGSGVIIDKEEGLVLTNAHVAAPSALGQAVTSFAFADELDDNPDEVELWVSDGLDQSAEPQFRAEVVAVDGYLDIAVLKITSKLSGAQIEDDDLADLSEVPLGDSDLVRTSDPITFYGYPAAADSKAPTYTTGVVSGPVQDDRLESGRAALNTTATSSFGNSGGLAVNEDGEMVGVVTWGRPDQYGQVVLSSIRPINFAKPVIEAAEKGEDYTTPWTVAGPATARVDELSYAALGKPAAVTPGCRFSSSGASLTTLAVEYTGFPGGEHTDVAAALIDESGNIAGVSFSEFDTSLDRSGCMTLTFSRRVPAGSYLLKIGVGGDLRVVYDGVLNLD